MCTGAEIAALAGTGAQVYDAQRVQRDQAKEAERRLRETNALSERAGSRVSQEIEKLKADDTVGQEEARLQDDFMAALRRAQLANGGSGALSDAESGAVSDTFRQDAATARRANVAGNRAAVANTAALDSPILARLREAGGESRFRTDLGRIQSEGQGQDFLAQLRASLIQPNAGLNAAGDFAVGYGQGAASRLPKPKKPGYSGPPRTVDSTIPGGG